MHRHLEPHLPDLDESFLGVLLEYIECSKADKSQSEVTGGCKGAWETNVGRDAQMTVVSCLRKVCLQL